MAVPSAVLPQELVMHALKARTRAYAPYSRYQVGAAVLTADGTVIYGCNVENAAYPSTICAERVALTAAIAQGHRHFLALAVATENGGTPCGACRQVMAELGPEMDIYIADSTGKFWTAGVLDLLPSAFDGEDLHKTDEE